MELNIIMENNNICNDYNYISNQNHDDCNEFTSNTINEDINESTSNTHDDNFDNSDNNLDNIDGEVEMSCMTNKYTNNIVRIFTLISVDKKKIKKIRQELI